MAAQLWDLGGDGASKEQTASFGEEATSTSSVYPEEDSHEPEHRELVGRVKSQASAQSSAVHKPHLHPLFHLSFTNPRVFGRAGNVLNF